MNDIKLKEGFVLREVCGVNVVMPTGKKLKEFKGALMLNVTGKEIFAMLQTDKSIEEIVEALTATYDVTPEHAKQSVLNTIEQLRETGVME